MARTGNNTQVPALGAYGGGPTFAADLTEIADDMAKIASANVATVSALPTTGNWPLRSMWVDSAKCFYVWSGATWGPVRPPFATASGFATSGTTGGGSISPVFWSSGVSVTFPAGLFSVAPIVTVAAQSAGIVWAQVEWATTTNAALKVMRLGSAPNAERINWHAVQQTASSAAG